MGGLPSLKSILREGSTSARMQGFCRAFKRGVDAGFVLVMSLPAAVSAFKGPVAVCYNVWVCGLYGFVYGASGCAAGRRSCWGRL